MQLLKLSPEAIRVKDGLARFRTDGGEIDKLMASIQKFGQLQPVVINRQHELICGGRRLLACSLLGVSVNATYQDTIDPLQMREIELEENLQRKDFTPGEKALAVEEIHKLKQQIHGKATPGVKNSGWTIDQTAESLGVTRGSVIDSLQIAESIHMYPNLMECTTSSEIKKTAKTITKLKDTLKGVKKYEDAAKVQCNYSVFHQEAEAFLSSQPDNKYNVFLLDPPYALNIQDTMTGIAGITGGMNSSGIKFDDSKEAMDLSIAALAKHLYRITTFNSQGYIFTAPEFFYPTREVMIAAGWKVYVKPIVWIKNASGQCNYPSYWPASCYEFIMFLRKEDARLVMEGRPDWVQFSPIIGEAKLHQTEKPVQLLVELLERISIPGQQLLDCFCGSGSSLEAGLRKKLFVTGVDKLLECYSVTLKRLGELKL